MAKSGASKGAKKRKPKAKRDEHGRFVKKTEDTADLTTPSF